MSKKISIIILFCGLALTLVPSVVSARYFDCSCKQITGGTEVIGPLYYSLSPPADLNECAVECAQKYAGKCVSTSCALSPNPPPDPLAPSAPSAPSAPAASAAQYGCYCKGDTANLNLMETFNNSNDCSLKCMTSAGKLCEGYKSGSCSKMPETSTGKQTSPSGPAAVLINPLGITSLPALIGRVISAILGIVGSLALVMFIWGGFLWMTAHGNPNQITKGRDTLVWATIGLVIIFLSYTLVNFVIKGITGTLPAGGGGGGNGQTCVCTSNKPAEAPTTMPNYTQKQCDDLQKLIGGTCVLQ